VQTPEKVLLVTHLMYYGYCFNPVSLYYVLKPTTTDISDPIIEAIVVEVSNTPWNETSIYVLHQDSVDVSECSVTTQQCKENGFSAPSHRYKFRKNFHVSPFMTMDPDYDWTFQMSKDRIHVLAKMIKSSTSLVHLQRVTFPYNWRGLYVDFQYIASSFRYGFIMRPLSC
jgi:DUF1365 family protein